MANWQQYGFIIKATSIQLSLRRGLCIFGFNALKLNSTFRTGRATLNEYLYCNNWIKERRTMTLDFIRTYTVILPSLLYRLNKGSKETNENESEQESSSHKVIIDQGER